MLKEIRKYLILAAIGGAFYGLLSYHFIYFDWNDIELLKKEKLTLSNTFVNVGDIEHDEFRGPKYFLKDDVLREAGIGDLFVERGILTEQRRYQLELDASSY